MGSFELGMKIKIKDLTRPACSPRETLQVLRVAAAVALGFTAGGCHRQPVEGPDKMFAGTGIGALEGAGAGAITGAQFTAATGPGAAIGAGFGAVMGGIHGAMRDELEETQMKIGRRTEAEKRRIVAQETLTTHYQRRMEMHPTRDIYPADIFFRGDSSKMCPSGVGIVREMAALNRFRLPYSRLVVVAYAKSTGIEDTTYVQYLTDRRSREFVNQLVKAGVEPRRLETRSVIVDAPVLLDPKDDPTRYNQAIEIIPIDR
jgi:outer membrane protein OmpA-like peptidoglycan-associated protein